MTLFLIPTILLAGTNAWATVDREDEITYYCDAKITCPDGSTASCYARAPQDTVECKEYPKRVTCSDGTESFESSCGLKPELLDSTDWRETE